MKIIYYCHSEFMTPFEANAKFLKHKIIDYIYCKKLVVCSHRGLQVYDSSIIEVSLKVVLFDVVLDVDVPSYIYFRSFENTE